MLMSRQDLSGKITEGRTKEAAKRSRSPKVTTYLV